MNLIAEQPAENTWTAAWFYSQSLIAAKLDLLVSVSHYRQDHCLRSSILYKDSHITGVFYKASVYSNQAGEIGGVCDHS